MDTARRQDSNQLNQIFKRCAGAYSDRMLIGYGNDLQHFQSWCEIKEADWLPADPLIVAKYVDDFAQSLAFSTIRRRVEAIKFAHRLLDLPSPAESSSVKLALRRASRSKSVRPKQSEGMSYSILQRIIAACPDDLAGQRDAALISLGYDSLARSYELSLLEVGHLGEDCATILVPRAKSDPSGEGRVAYLSSQTQRLIKQWLDKSGIVEGPLFQGLHTRKLSGRPLNTSSIRRLIKTAAGRAQIDKSVARSLSGHSMRVGAAQDMMIAGLDHIAIMQAGGWKTIDVVARYVENAAAQNLHRRRWTSLAGEATSNASAG